MRVLDLSGHNYQLTLASAALFSLLCLVCMARLSVNFSTTALSKLNTPQADLSQS